MASEKECKDDRITLDVGGTLFVTTIATLCSQPDSMLATMFSERWEKKDRFLDRSGEYFRLILDWLRSPSVSPAVEPLKRAALMTEARYFLLDRLCTLLEVDDIRSRHRWVLRGKIDPPMSFDSDHITPGVCSTPLECAISDNRIVLLLTSGSLAIHSLRRHNNQYAFEKNVRFKDQSMAVSSVSPLEKDTFLLCYNNQVACVRADGERLSIWTCSDGTRIFGSLLDANTIVVLTSSGFLLLRYSSPTIMVEPLLRFGTDQVKIPAGITVHERRIYAIDQGIERVVIFDANGTLQMTIDLPARPISLAVDKDGLIYVGLSTFRLMIYHTSGALLHVYMADVGLMRPRGLFIDKMMDDLYICDSANNTILVLGHEKPIS